MAFQYGTVNSGDMSTHYHARSLIKIGISQGIEKEKLIYQVDLMIKKVKKGKSIAQIADELECSEDEIRTCYDAVVSSRPEYDIDTILNSAAAAS